jgi:hypothetical protein
MQMTMTVSLAKGEYATPRPELEIRLPKGTHFRQQSAVMHRIAAEVELATPAREGWVVQTEALYDDRCRVYLELVVGDDAEAERGMTLLRAVAR